jgi:DNA-binding MarR family transcriptional regulator
VKKAGTRRVQHAVDHGLHFDGPQPMKRLAERLAVTPRNITGLVDALEADALACRKPNPSDGRSSLISLTDAGAELMHDLQCEHIAATGRLLDAVPPASRDHLHTALSELRRALLDAHARKPADGTCGLSWPRLRAEPTAPASGTGARGNCLASHHFRPAMSGLRLPMGLDKTRGDAVRRSRSQLRTFVSVSRSPR